MKADAAFTRSRVEAWASSWRPAHVAFAAVCLWSEGILFTYDRASAYTGLGAFAYGLALWLIARACIRFAPQSEDVALRPRADGPRLYARLAVVAGALAFVAFETSWGARLIWNSTAEAAVQHFSAAVGLGYGDTALPNFIVYVVLPATLLFALRTKPIEIGLAAWRKGAGLALLGACVLPAIFIGLWFAHGRGTVGLLGFVLARNFLSNGFSEEFLMRGVTMSHLRAFCTKEWALVLQAILFGAFHVGGTIGEQHGDWVLALSNVIALNAPMGFFLGLIAMRARSVALPGLIHTTLDTMKDILT